jgi:hypothetical protein
MFDSYAPVFLCVGWAQQKCHLSLIDIATGQALKQVGGWSELDDTVLCSPVH